MKDPVVGTSFAGISQDICATAWNLIQPNLKHFLTAGITNRRAGCVVVYRLDDAAANTNHGRENDPIFEGFIDDCPSPDLYRDHAIAKAHVSLATGLSSREVLDGLPHLYRPGMTRWGGSLVRDRLVCAFSGVQPEFDEMFAGYMIDTIVALCRHEVARPGGLDDATGSILGIWPAPA